MKRFLFSFLMTMLAIVATVKINAALVVCSLNTFNVNGGTTNAAGITNAVNGNLVPGTNNVGPTNVVSHGTTNYFYNTNIAGIGVGQSPAGYSQTYSGAYFTIPLNTELFFLSFTGMFANTAAAQGNNSSNVVLTFDGSLDLVTWQSNVFQWTVPIVGSNLTTVITNPAQIYYGGKSGWLYLGLNTLGNANVGSGDLTNIVLKGLYKPAL